MVGCRSRRRRSTATPGLNCEGERRCLRDSRQAVLSFCVAPLFIYFWRGFGLCSTGGIVSFKTGKAIILDVCLCEGEASPMRVVTYAFSTYPARKFSFLLAKETMRMSITLR